MSWKIELHTFSSEEVMTALAALDETNQTSKRQIIITPEQYSTLEATIRPLPNDPNFPQGEIVPGVAGYLYNLPVFVDQDSGGSYLV